MSDTIAPRRPTVAPVRRRQRSRVVPSLLLAIAAAEAGVRLLRPRAPSVAPAPIDVRTYFTAEEIDRGAKFARPQLALGLARGAVELAGLIGINRRPPRGARSRPHHAALDGAAAAAGGAPAAPLAPLPPAAGPRRRAVAVGVVTPSSGGW